MEIIKILLIFVAVIMAHHAKAEELGNFRFSGYHIETEFVAGEDSFQASGFHLGRSTLGFEWDKSEKIGGVLQISNNDLVEATRWYNSDYEHKSIFSVAYAYHQVNSSSKLLMGIFQVPFGLESYLGVPLRELQDSLFIQRKYVSYSDLGFGFASEHEGLRTDMFLHNGAGVVRDRKLQNDNKFFYTGRVVKESESGELYGLSAQFGQYQKQSETTLRKLSMLNLMGMARLFGGYLSWDASIGSDKSADTDTKFHSYYLDYRYPLSPSLSVQLRHNQLEPDTVATADQVTNNSLAFSLNDRNANSRFSFIYSETKEENGQKNQVGFLNWKLSSLHNKRY